MNRRAFLGNAIAGLLGCSVPAGLLGSAAVGQRAIVGGVEMFFGVDHGIVGVDRIVHILRRGKHVVSCLVRPGDLVELGPDEQVLIVPATRDDQILVLPPYR